MSKLDVFALEKALALFEKALIRFNTDLNDLEVRDACIQRFDPC